MSLTQKEHMKSGLKAQIAEIRRQMGEKEGQISGIVKGLE